MIDTISPPKIYTNRSSLPKTLKKIDYYDHALKELFFIENPAIKEEMPEADNKLTQFIEKKQKDVKPIWIYYPWKDILIKTVPEKVYFKLRTSRNRNIITENEQKNYRGGSVGIIGLSIGSATLASLAMTGGPKHLRVADFDIIEITNLNRLHGTLLDVGRKKTQVAAERLWELDPFAKIDIWDKKVNINNLKKFIKNTPKLDVLVDAMDSLDIKIATRLFCREKRIPVIMATSNGNSVIIDVERFDLDSKPPIFQGRIDDVDIEFAKDLSTKSDYKRWVQLATKIVDPKLLTEVMHDSLPEIGHSISGVPQIGTTVNMAGAAVSYIIRRILNKQNIPSGRYLISLEEKLIPNYNSSEEKKRRGKKMKKFINNFPPTDEDK